ncbi:YugN-like family protein [Geomicrobium sp. JCM 19038]|uniref:YugN-like family protein n=1 Tax=Geomicrobium sp. JCM 19038 TaxID=1460635 RepID=UPI00045F4711|nr:YugN-like family protein [Geomicrobium sp. JCM 19038]GAK08591.1 hypothetical protein JCM19038_2377 [Geomicrobium sp. JCM 19038]
MIELRSAITDLTLNMHDLEKQLHPLGFVTSDNWIMITDISIIKWTTLEKRIIF